MLKTKSINTTKKEISKKISKEIGLPVRYISTIIDEFLYLLKDSLKKKNINLKNFGSFKILYKNERIGRNPKNKKNYKIDARKAVVFSPSKYLNNKIN